MEKQRILVIDESVFVRRLLVMALIGDDQVERVDTMPDPRPSLARIARIGYDIVVMRAEPGNTSTAEVLKMMRTIHPDLPVLRIAEGRGPAGDADRFPRGELVALPPGLEKDEPFARRWAADELVPKLRALGAEGPRTATPVPAAPAPARGTPGAGPCAPVRAIVLGASTGGIEAIPAVLGKLPADLPVPVLIVQHLPENFVRRFAKRLDERTPLRVADPVAGLAVKPGCVYVAPGDYHMSVKRDGLDVRIDLDRNPLVNHCRPAVDVLFDSAADVYGSGVLGVVLTGMGRDGREGARRIRSRGGRILVQDRETSVVWGMPGAIVSEDLADEVVPLAEVPTAILRSLNHGAAVRAGTAA